MIRSTKTFRKGEYLILAFFVICALAVFGVQVYFAIHLEKYSGTTWLIVIYQTYTLLTFTILTFIFLIYNLRHYYRFDYEQNKKSMVYLFCTELSMLGAL